MPKPVSLDDLVTESCGCVFCDMDLRPVDGIHRVKAEGEWHEIPCRARSTLSHLESLLREELGRGPWPR